MWEATGPNSGAVTAIIPFSDGQGGGVAKWRATFEVSSDGQSVTIDWEGELFRDGAPTGEHFGPGTDTGTRINVEPMGTSGGLGYVRAHHLQLNGREAPYRDSLVAHDTPELPISRDVAALASGTSRCRPTRRSAPSSPDAGSCESVTTSVD